MSSQTVPLHLSEWPFPELETQLRNNLKALIQEVETTNSITLERLEGVSVVENLAASLKSFDAGYPSDHAAAMRDTIVGRMITTNRDGRVQGHIFLPIAAAVEIAKKDGARLYAYMFAHECAHLQDLETRAKCLTTVELLNPPLAQPIALTQQIAWNEYAACRLSAYADPDRSEDFKELLRQNVDALLASRDKPRAAFAAPIEARIRALNLALDLALPVLQAFSYLLGHCRGIARELAELVPENYLALTSDQQIREAFADVERHLDLLWQSRDQWQGYSAFNNLVAANCRLIAELTGIVMAARANREMGVGLTKQKAGG